MSRCFSYPPPGYTPSGAKNEVLIESIKLQKEKEKERKEKKEKRKEKKETRKERKEKRKERKERKNEKKVKENQSSGSSDILKRFISNDKIVVHKKKEAENNQLEQSSLTEEHACPATLPVPSSSSESTENSKKRKRHSPSDGDACGHGKAMLIRVPSKKLNELNALVKEQLQPCSTSGKIDTPDENGDANRVKDLRENFPNGARIKDCEANTKNRQAETGKFGNKSKPGLVLSSMQKLELHYQNLFANLFPPQAQESWHCPDDLDWLLKWNYRCGREIRAGKLLGSENDGVSCSRSLGLWPHAEYLHEADVYALPFTVPY